MIKVPLVKSKLCASLIVLPGLMMAQGCAMPPDRSCFTARPHVVTPSRTKALANLTNGSSGRNLVEAILGGNAERAAAMLRADPALRTTEVTYDPRGGASRPDGQYGDLLTFAVSTCDPAIVAALLEAGLPADGQQIGQALTLALLADTPVMAELMLRAGASPDPQKKGGQNAMYEVTAHGHEGAVLTLIRHKADMDWVGPFGDGYLQDAVDMEQYRIAELLVEAGANLWQVSGAGAVPAQALSGAMILDNKENDAARTRLLTKAKRPGLPWPPPKPTEMRAQVLAGIWPTPAMSAAGMRVPDQSLADMQARFGKPSN
jgi:hypothetical protein